jgi:hypothetical protein
MKASVLMPSIPPANSNTLTSSSNAPIVVGSFTSADHIFLKMARLPIAKAITVAFKFPTFSATIRSLSKFVA